MAKHVMGRIVKTTIPRRIYPTRYTKCPGWRYPTFPSSYVKAQKHGNDRRIKMRDFNSQARRERNPPIKKRYIQLLSKDEGVLGQSRGGTQQLREGANGRSHLIQEDRIKEEMFILNGPITFTTQQLGEWTNGKVPFDPSGWGWEKQLQACFHAIGCMQKQGVAF
ncbi:unnamed protein product [Microthlaspi erraticum]|uniref:Uncharacterized protein n=1 Tax=Microthlaspi erraticum TaxID=1685480 RepID=A0A6D2KBV1_9BRAS|nr:unnamed protein product [Microthlaspi erraticum]